jgi:nitrate/nitrite transport system ATP-binding protein
VAFLELVDVWKSYGARSVLSRIHLALDEGEFVSIVGTSASGKSTLLKIACGLIAPDRGSVTLGGALVREFSRDAAIVFQNYSLLPWLSAAENVRLAVEAAHPDWANRRIAEQAEKYLQMVGLGNALAKKPGQLSGGMRQRVAIARAFAVEPRVLFLDEPFGALDALTRATLQLELARLCSEAGRTVTTLMITNSVDEAVLLSDRILALSRGPGASLSPDIVVPFERPRAADLLLHDERAVRVRTELAGFLAGRRPSAGEARLTAQTAPQSVPVEA